MALSFWETGWQFKCITSVAQRAWIYSDAAIWITYGARVTINVCVQEICHNRCVETTHTHTHTRFLLSDELVLHRFFTWWIRWTCHLRLGQWQLLRQWWVGVVHFWKCWSYFKFNSSNSGQHDDDKYRTLPEIKVQLTLDHLLSTESHQCRGSANIDEL